MSVEEIKQENGPILLSIELQKEQRDTMGVCANPKCKETVYLSEIILDDTYNCVFRCPYCHAYQFLDNSGRFDIRGYGGGQMHLELPDAKEVIMNNLPTDTPTKD